MARLLSSILVRIAVSADHACAIGVKAISRTRCRGASLGSLPDANCPVGVISADAPTAATKVSHRRSSNQISAVVRGRTGLVVSYDRGVAVLICYLVGCGATKVAGDLDSPAPG
jgi:hypothetical protein